MLNMMLDAWTSLALTPFATASSDNGGDFVTHRYQGQTGSLRYKLYVPSSYVGSPLPLVLMLHGGGQDAEDFALGTGMNELAEETGCLVAYPEQSTEANWSRCWNWFDRAHHHRGRGEPALIAGLAQQLMADYAVDRSRVYVGGLSAGGAMAVIVGRTYPELFAAVGCHSGLAHGSATDQYAAAQVMRDGAAAPALAGPASSPPVIVFHGDQDFTVHPNNGAGVVRQSIDCHMAQAAHAAQTPSVSEETGETAGRGFVRQVYKAHTGRVLAEHWIVGGVGHAWCGGKRRGSYTEAGGPDASREMLRFFLQQRLPAKASVKRAQRQAADDAGRAREALAAGHDH